ncbi:MAG: restriction endonuclease subunit S [Nannocystaceae bacterium]
MISGWTECRLEDIQAEESGALAGGPFGSDLVSADYQDAGVPVIRGSNFDAESRFIRGPFVFVTPEKAELLARNQARPGDVIFTQRGTLDQVALLPDDLGHDAFVISQSQMKLTCDRKRVLPEYVYYWFRSPRALDYIHRHTIATGVPHTNLGILRQTPLLLPPLAEQERIVGYLLALDDRIAALRGIQGAADQLFHLLFSAWFVDFTPIHDPSASAVPDEAAALYPDELEEGPHGVAPRGWPFRPLLAAAEFQNGTAFKNSDFTPAGEGLPVIKIAELRRGVGRQTRWSESGGARRRLLRDGDLLFAWSGNPQTSIGSFLWGGGDAWLNQHIFKVIPEAPETRPYLYGLLTHLLPRLVEIARNHQTTGLGHIAKKDLRKLMVPTPPAELIVAFHAHSEALVDAMIETQREIGTLGRARDLLLPQLLSGQLRLGDVVPLRRR